MSAMNTSAILKRVGVSLLVGVVISVGTYAVAIPSGGSSTCWQASAENTATFGINQGAPLPPSGDKATRGVPIFYFDGVACSATHSEGLVKTDRFVVNSLFWAVVVLAVGAVARAIEKKRGGRLND